MPTIEVFLVLKPTERNSETKDKKKIVEAGPNWKAIAADLKTRGYTLVVHGPSFRPSIQEIRDSLRTAEVTVIVGHGSESSAGPKFIADHINLSDGVIRSPDGVLVGKWNANGDLERTDNNSERLSINKVTGLFTCNSTDRMPGAFDLPSGSHLITNDGGSDGLTRLGTLELGAAEFVRWYARTKGDVRTAMTRAQMVFTAKGSDYTTDKGDKLSDKVGVAPPLPERCEVKDW